MATTAVRGEIELDALARVYLGDPEITDHDRVAFALRELRKRGYDVEACPVDWPRPMMICSVPGLDVDGVRPTTTLSIA